MKMIGWFEFHPEFDIETVSNVELEVMTDGGKYYGYSNGDTVQFLNVRIREGLWLADIQKITVVGAEFYLMGNKVSAVKCEYPKDSKWAHSIESIHSRAYILMEDGQIHRLTHYPNCRCLVNINGSLKPLEDIKSGIVRVAYHKLLPENESNTEFANQLTN